MFAALNIKLYFIKKLFFLSSILFLFINFVDIKKNKNLSEINFPKNSSVVFPYLQKNFIGFITFGSRWEYNQKGDYQPNSFYAATKHASDYLLQYFANKQTTIVSLKIFDTYGENDNRKKILNLLLKSYKNQTTLKLSPGKQEIDLVNILDICELVSKICTDIKIKKIRGFKKFTVSSKKPIKLIQLIKILKKNLKKKLKCENWGIRI